MTFLVGMTLLAISVSIVLDIMISYITMRRVIRNHFELGFTRILLMALGFFFMAEALGELAQMTHIYIHLNTDQPFHEWLNVFYWLETVTKAAFIIVAYIAEKNYPQKDLTQ
jgi:hypothetical protein